ncbi:unnamed protein product [Schistosoma margrebowiei]|uniref:LIM zinc-binding domain-containing protein n=1 Tax=Schistosoma margrebowiei TaxID=48269 RepID=A0AA84ZNJ0_9TREM|nr:unnamed protein product [Schistosoma margrebowiei]
MINIIPLLCTGCQQPIWDPYLLCIDQNIWHEQCVTCSICHCLLHNKCLVRNQKLYCRSDYIKQFGIRCKGCNQLIQSNDSVLRLYTYKSMKSTSIQNDFMEKQNIHEFQSSIVTSTNTTKINISTPNKYELNLPNEEVDNTKDSFDLSVLIHYFHVDCFKCCDCNRLLTYGEEYTIKNGMPLCIMDYEKYLLDKESQNICTRLQESFKQSIQYEKYTQDMNNNINDNYSNVTNNEDNKMNEQQERDFNEESNDTDLNCKESNRLMIIDIKSDIGNYDKSTSSTMDTSLLNDSVLLSDINISAPNSSDDSSKDGDRMDDDELYEMDSDSESGKNSKRPRTILTANQRRRFKAVFEFNPKPTRKIKKLARRHAQESRQQSNRRMLINNPMINNEPMIRIQSPNSMLFNLRNPTISDIPYLYKTVDHCQDITSLQNEPINENDPDEILKKRMLSLATSCSPPFIHIPQVNQIENPYPANISYISTTSKAMENSSLTFSTHELFPCLNSVCTNSKSSSLLSEVPFTPITSSGLMISNNNNNNNSNDNIHNNTNTTTNNNNVENNSTTNGSSTFDTSINKLYSMHQSYFM